VLSGAQQQPLQAGVGWPRTSVAA